MDGGAHQASWYFSLSVPVFDSLILFPVCSFCYDGKYVIFWQTMQTCYPDTLLPDSILHTTIFLWTIPQHFYIPICFWSQLCIEVQYVASPTSVKIFNYVFLQTLSYVKRLP